MTDNKLPTWKRMHFHRGLHSQAPEFEQRGWRGVAMHVIDSIPEGGALFEIDELPPDEVSVKETKDDWSLIPWEQLRQVTKAFTFGSTKHGALTYRTKEGARDLYFSKAMRHIVDWQCGKRADEETGLSPLAHAIADLLVAMLHEGK